MSIIEFIILAIALSFETMIAMHASASSNPIKLTLGLAESLTVAAVNAMLLVIGIWLGFTLRFSPADADPMAQGTYKLLSDTDSLVYLGLMIIVAIRLLLHSGKKNRQRQPYDISKFSTATLLAVAMGINTLIVGLAIGFRLTPPTASSSPISLSALSSAVIPLLIIMTLMTFLGVMLGRQQKELRSRRYTLVAALLILAFALKGAFWG